MAGPPLLEATLLTLVALVVYWITGPPADGDMWPPLAEAFLSGQLHLDQDRPWLELVPRPEGGQYVPLPPVPALTLVPAALVTGPGAPWGELDGNAYASIVGALNVGLAYWLLLGWGVAPSPRRWITIGFAFTTHWWVAGMAGPHHYAEICAVLFGLAALNLAVRGRSALAAGFLLGLAAGSRLPTALAFPAVAALYARAPHGGWRIGREHAWLVAGVAVPALALAVYNVARFGSPIDFGYAHIPSGESGLITDEPWFSEGLLSVTYIPRHLKVIFLDGFQFVAEAPFLRPSLVRRLAGPDSAVPLPLGPRARADGAMALAQRAAGHAAGPDVGIVGLRAVRLSPDPRRDAAPAAAPRPRLPRPQRLGAAHARHLRRRRPCRMASG